MATTATRLMTAEEFFDFCHLEENRDRHFELEQGKIIEMSLPGERHGVVCSNVTGLLWNYTRKRGKGYVCTNDVGLIIERDPDTVRGPDVALYDETRRYEELNVKYTDRPPALVVEVLSPHDRPGKVMRRVSRFLSMGVRLVWVLDPDDRTATVCRSGQVPAVLEADKELTGEEVLSDLRCKVADFFAMPGAPQAT